MPRPQTEGDGRHRTSGVSAGRSKSAIWRMPAQVRRRGLWRLTGVTGLLFAAAYGLSQLMGPVASMTCGLAIGVTILTWVLWAIGISRTGRGPEGVRGLVGDVLAAGPWLRLRTTVTGMVMGGLMLEEGVLWFVGWTGFFYVALLVGQTRLVIRMLNAMEWKRGLWSG